MKPIIKPILYAGLLAGTLDGLAACIQFYCATGKSPVIVFQYIASSVAGKEGYAGKEMPVLGLLMHYAIATSFAAFYFLLYPKLKLGFKGLLAPAFFYGILIWSVMNLVVVPLSKAPGMSMQFTKILVSAGILIVFVALPITVIAEKYFEKELDRQPPM